MTRLIDADALEKAIYEWMPKDQETWADSDIPPIENLVVSIMMTIQEQPTIDAEPVRHGRWIGYPKCLKYENALTDDDYACSCCGEVFNCISNDMERFDYCPHCGAKMDAEGMLLAKKILQHLAEELGKTLSEIAERFADVCNEYLKSEDDNDRKID